MIREWLIKKLLENKLIFIKNNETKEYYMVYDILFDDGDMQVLIFESKPVEKRNEIRSG